MSTPTSTPPSVPPQLPPAMPAYATPPKSPGLALLLSFLFPGMGQVYNGQPAKALVFFAVFVGSIWGCVNIDPLPFALFIPFTLIYNYIDAYRSAAILNMKAAGGEPIEEDTGVESPAWGGTLVALGLILLLNNLGWLPLRELQRWWPILLILGGGAMLHGSFRQKRESSETSAEESGTSEDADATP